MSKGRRRRNSSAGEDEQDNLKKEVIEEMSRIKKALLLKQLD